MTNSREFPNYFVTFFTDCTETDPVVGEATVQASAPCKAVELAYTDLRTRGALKGASPEYAIVSCENGMQMRFYL